MRYDNRILKWIDLMPKLKDDQDSILYKVATQMAIDNEKEQKHEFKGHIKDSNGTE